MILILLSVLEQGMIYAIMALGIYITYKILDFPDLTVDGSFPLGAAVAAVMISKDVNPLLTLPVCFLVGAIVGVCTGLIHVKLKVRDLLSGIIMMTALYTAELRVAGRANLPFYNKTTQRGLVAHFGAICEQVHIPIIVYNVPSRTGLNVLPATMKEIVDTCENVVGIKEASGNIEQIVNLAAMCPGLDIYSGNDDHILPVLSVGGKGVISTIANVVPSEVHNLCMAFFAGKLDIARKLQFSLLPIWRAAFCETNPIPIKTMMSMMDLCSPELRLPLIPPSRENEEKMRKALRDFGLIS